MARVTVEDCIEKVPSRFELVMLASQRARKIGSGAPLLVDRDNDKNPVIALREIAEEKINTEDMKEELIKNHQRVIEMDDTEEVIDMMEGEEEWGKKGADIAPAEPLEGSDNALQDLAGTSYADQDVEVED